jgi:hypothetical protein
MKILNEDIDRIEVLNEGIDKDYKRYLVDGLGDKYTKIIEYNIVEYHIRI